MARKPHMIPNALRDARQLLVNAAPLVQETAGVEEVGVTLTFVDPEGKQHPSPRGASYAADMHAYFTFTCPLRDCTGGGFDANADLLRALSRRQDGHTGKLTCTGTRPRNGIKNLACGIELHYKLALRLKTKAAA
jgi:hypothetical protein